MSNSSLQDVQKELTDLFQEKEDQIISLKNESESQAAKIDGLTKENEKLKENIDRLTGKLDELNETLDTYKSERIKLLKQLAEG